MKVYFERVIVPCVVDDVIAWHVEHGWVWDVVVENRPDRMSACASLAQMIPSRKRAEDGAGLQRIGVFFCTLLCGDGVILHFSTVKGMKIPWYVVMAAMRKGVRMVAGAVNVVYATIPEEKRKLVKVVEGLGFRSVDEYFRNRPDRPDKPDRIIMMKYLHGEKGYINDER